MIVERLESIAEVDPGEWDRLAGDHPLASHGWLQTVEETHSEPSAYRYFVARDGSGELSAAIPCQVHGAEGAPSSPDHFLFGRAASLARAIRMSAAPALLCGTRFPICEPVLFHRGLTAGRRKLALDSLLAAVRDEARDESATALFRHVTLGTDVARTLEAVGYLGSRELPTAYLDLPWSSFAEYRRELRGQHRSTEKSIRWELGRARKAGVVVERIHSPGPRGQELHLLLDTHYRRLNQTAFPFGPDFLVNLARCLGERAILSIARRGEEALGVTVGLRGGGETYLLMIGIDHERGREAATYYNLAFNWAIEQAIASGDRRIYFGKLLYDLKLRRGCRLAAAEVFVLGRNRWQRGILRPFVALRSSRLDRRATTLSAAASPRRWSAAGVVGRARPRVFVTSATSDAGLAAIRALTREGYEVLAADSRRLPLGARSRYSSADFLLPASASQGYDQALLEALEASKPDAILPVGQQSVLAAVRLSEQLAARTALNVPGPDALEAAHDKAVCMESCRALGIPVPRVLSLDEARESLIEGGPQPMVVVKPKLNLGAAQGVGYAGDLESLDRCWALCQGAFGGALLQEHIPGDVESMSTVVLLFSPESHLVASFTMRKLRQWPPEGGLTVMGRSTWEPALIEQVLPFFEHWRWRGPAEVELKYDRRDGLHKVIEVNPRFPAYLRLPLRCGLDLPTRAVRLAMGQRVEGGVGLPEYRVNGIYLNPGLFARSVIGEARSRRITLRPGTVFDLWRALPGLAEMLADPLPMLGRIVAEARAGEPSAPPRAHIFL